MTRAKSGACPVCGGALPVVRVDARALRPSPENALLYRDRSADDADFARLVESVRAQGVATPLLVSRDHYILSGHQRRRAAILAKRYGVPVIVLDFCRAAFSEDEWLAKLREYNTGREKTLDELVRERLVDIDPEEAVAQVLDHHAERSRVRLPTIDVGDRKMVRYGISAEKQDMVEAILAVLRDLQEYLPVSLRAIHYRLLVKVFFRNSKMKLRYANDKDSYKDLSNVATRLRLKGEIPWEAICDETRPVKTWLRWRHAAAFIEDEVELFLAGYARDLLQSQAQHFEIVAEKLTVQSFVEPVADRYGMPVVILRGNSGIDARHQMVERFRASGKLWLFLLCLGDCDPDGDNIVESTLRSLRDDFGIANARGVRVAMTHAQADRLHLPTTLDANEDSANYERFVAAHGRTDCYELDAVAPEVLQEWLDTAIRGVIDINAYNHELQEWRVEAAEIQARREAILQLLRDAPGDRPRTRPRTSPRSRRTRP
jgi:hypothetical protein